MSSHDHPSYTGVGYPPLPTGEAAESAGQRRDIEIIKRKSPVSSPPGATEWGRMSPSGTDIGVGFTPIEFASVVDGDWDSSGGVETFDVSASGNLLISRAGMYVIVFQRSGMVIAAAVDTVYRVFFDVVAGAVPEFLLSGTPYEATLATRWNSLAQDVVSFPLPDATVWAAIRQTDLDADGPTEIEVQISMEEDEVETATNFGTWNMMFMRWPLFGQ